MEQEICLAKRMGLLLSSHPHHMLNLAVVKSLDVPCVRNMIGVVNKVSMFFFAHPKRCHQ